MDIEFTVRLVVKNAIDPESLRDYYDNDPLQFIRYLVQEEGLQGCTEDDFQILTAQAANGDNCEACNGGYRLAKDGLHYNDESGGATWGVCRKVTARLANTQHTSE